MIELQTKFPSDTWVVVTWDEYVQAIEDPVYEKAKCYYYNGQVRIEMPPVGPDHAYDNGIMAVLIYSFGIAKAIKLKLKINRKR